MTALHWAADRGHVAVAEHLISASADVGGEDADRRLHAATSGQPWSGRVRDRNACCWRWASDPDADHLEQRCDAAAPRRSGDRRHRRGCCPSGSRCGPQRPANGRPGQTPLMFCRRIRFAPASVRRAPRGRARTPGLQQLRSWTFCRAWRWIARPGRSAYRRWIYRPEVAEATADRYGAGTESKRCDCGAGS